MALTDNLIAHWKLDEESGNTRIDSHGDYDLPEYGGNVVNVTGKIGNAARFTGGSNYYLRRSSLEQSFHPETAGAYTIAAWAYRNANFSSDGGCPFLMTLGSYSAFNLFGENDGDYYNYRLVLFHTLSNGSSVEANIGIDSWALQTWQFVVGRWDGSNISISINAGTPQTTEATSIIDWASMGTTNLRCGRRETLDEDIYIDSVSFWHRALSDPEITQLYNSGNGLDYPFTTGLTQFALPMFRPA